MSSPIVSSLLAEIAATCLIFFGILAYGLRLRFEVFNSGGNSLVYTALKVQRICAGSHVLKAFLHDSLCQHSSGSGTVAGQIVGFRRLPV